MSVIPRVVSVVTAALVVALGVAPAPGRDLQRGFRFRKMSDAATMQSPPFLPPDGATDCSPTLPGIPNILGDAFDPASFDEIATAGKGRLVAYASSVAGGGPKSIVVLREGNASTSVQQASGDDDQPSIQLDSFGWRMAFRGSTGILDREAESDVFLHTVTRSSGDDGPGEDTRSISRIEAGSGFRAFDPALAARMRKRDAGSGVIVRERDARVAFVSDADLDLGPRPIPEGTTGKNADNVQQLFLWHEQARRVIQLTDNTDDLAEIARPSISPDGRTIAFESTADLTPGAANPLDPSQVGNPGGVRQIYVWEGRRAAAGFRQLTWGDRDSFAPRVMPRGRFVFFCSRADLLPGGNPERNFEIFRWRRNARPARRLAQLTQTTSGDSVLPRPTRSARRFAFYSTASPPAGGLPFGGSTGQCGPTAVLWRSGRVRLVRGLLDAETAALPLPVITGPPAPGATAAKIHFVTNDPKFDPPPPEDDDDDDDGVAGRGSLTNYHVVRATRFTAPR